MDKQARPICPMYEQAGPIRLRETNRPGLSVVSVVSVVSGSGGLRDQEPVRYMRRLWTSSVKRSWSFLLNRRICVPQSVQKEWFTLIM